MSLIAGILDFRGDPAKAHFLRGVLQGYQEYGPDGSGVWAEGPAALGHLMRHSTPESLGEKLPLASDDGRWAVTADARIDNRPELCEQLDVPPAERAGMTDSALILRAWRKWQADCPQHLEGDFTLAIYDRSNRELVLAQSVFPRSLLYYARTGRCFAFASLIRPLLALAGLPKRLDERSFARFASQTLPPAGGEPEQCLPTMFAGVERLVGATVLTVRADGPLHARTWWRPDPYRQLGLRSDREYYEGVRERMVRAVHDRLRSHRPVVCYLSGGLDSSSIACIAARKLRAAGKRLAALSSVLPLGHPGPERDERRFIDVVQGAEDLDVTYVYPSQGFLDDQTCWMNATESPVGTDKPYVYTALYQAALQRGAGVILDGGGGELGPSNHATGLFAWLARTGQWATLAAELRAAARVTGQNPFRLLLRHVVAPHVPGLQAWYHRIKNPAATVGTVELPLTQDFVQRHGLKKRTLPNDPRRLPQLDPKQYLSQAISLVQSGFGFDPSMAYGIRTLYPFADRRLLEFCLAVPARLYHVGGWRRSLIRRAMEGILPPEIQWRKSKAPFSPDFYRRFQSAWPALRAEFAATAAGDPVRDYYDISAICRTLDALKDRPGGEASPAGFRVKFCVQASLAGIRFLRWFQQIAGFSRSDRNSPIKR
jgi:asparagine synthase (glutamine-hydrolysing)